MISRDLGSQTNMEADCPCQLVAPLCAMFCTEKQSTRKKSVDEVIAEKTESTWLIHFAVRAGGEFRNNASYYYKLTLYVHRWIGE